MTFFNKIIRAFERAGEARAKRELSRFPYISQYNIHTRARVVR
jgi:hypothetical protein